MTSAVVFDLFHTLVDPEAHRSGPFDRLAESARLLGVDADALRDHWEDVVVEAATTPVRTAEVLARVCRERPSEAVLAAVDDAMGRYQDRAIREPLPEAVAALETLAAAGVRVGLLSNALERDVRAWDDSPLRSGFHAAVFSCFAGVMKPDPAAYRAVLEALGVTAGEAVFVGDGHSGELAGAKRAGFGTVVVVTGPALRSGLRTPAEMAVIAADADVEIGDVGRVPEVFGISRRPSGPRRVPPPRP